MPIYRITDKAGRFVAGRNNTGAGSTLVLSEREAEYEVALGSLVREPAPDAAGASPEPAPAPRSGRRKAADTAI